MAIVAGSNAKVTGIATGLVTPTWTGGNTPYTGALLIMVVQSSRLSNLTYFGNGNADPAGWNRFGSNLQAPSSNRSCALFWRIAGTGGTTNDTPSIAGYSSDGAGRIPANYAGNTSVTIMELQDNIVGTTCFGKWDVTNANGLGMSSGTMATWNVANTAGTATTLTVGASSWSDTYADTGLLVLAWHSGTLSSFTATPTTISPVTGGGSFIGGWDACSSGANLTTTLTDTAASTRSLLGYVVGFSPSTVRTPTQPATARIQSLGTPTQPATARIQSLGTPHQPATGTITLGISRTATIGATARIAAIATSAPLTTMARISITGSNTILAGAKILGPPWSPKILMGTGNSIEQALGTSYFELSGDSDNGDSNDLYTIVIDGGQAL